MLRERGVEPLVIGAMALAVHHHARQTVDFDLAVAMAPRDLPAIAEAFRREGLEVDLSSPDADDPLGGVLTIRRPEARPVQVVNFDNAPAGGFPALVRSALSTAVPIPGTRALRAVDLQHLIASKLYAGGMKSKLDVLELLARNRVDLDELRRFCARFRLDGKLERLLASVVDDD
jgi:hypothetical protein